jgi:hypothetical protein
MRNLASLAWLALVLAGLVGPLSAGAQPLPLYSLPDPNTTGIDNDQFGTALAIGGGLLVVGVPLADESATLTRTGAAYVFDLRTGQQRLKLAKSLAVDDDRVGAAVAVIGSPTARLIAVGVPGDDGTSSNRTHYGAVLLFDATTGSLVRTLTAPVPNANAEFGAALATVGSSLLAVGAPGDQVPSGPGTVPGGAVYVFDLSGTAPPERLTEPVPGANDEFGAALAAVGGKLLVGAPGALGARKPGAAYLFTPGSGSPPVSFTNPDSTSTGSLFGAAVAGVNGQVLVGAPQYQNGRGAAWLFAADGTLIRDLCSKPAVVTDNCGAAVAARGADILVGSPGAAVSSKNNAGKVYFFEGDKVTTLPDPTPASKNDGFGKTVAALGSFLAVAAPGRQVRSLASAGEVYVYGAALPAGTCAEDADCPEGQTCNTSGLCVTPQQPGGGGSGGGGGGGGGAAACAGLQGVAALHCLVAEIAALLEPNIGAFRGPLVVRVKKLVSQAELQVSAVETAGSKRRARRKLNGTRTTLQAFLHAVKRASKHHRIDGGLAGELETLAQSALAQIPAARASLH